MNGSSYLLTLVFLAGLIAAHAAHHVRRVLADLLEDLRMARAGRRHFSWLSNHRGLR